MAIFGMTVFSSAFLLFLVQPLIGKYILPWFGGSPAVWTTCMLFFQVVLLAGYGCAHLIATRLGVRRQAQIYLALLVLATLTLPITPSGYWKPVGNVDPRWRILGLLTVSVGLPYLQLSSIGPLLQSWLARINPGRSPYRLYAISNAGSLAAIIGYPFLVEPAFGVALQTRLWSLAYVAFGCLSAWVAVALHRTAGRPAAQSVGAALVTPPVPVTAAAVREPTTVDKVLWVVLPACASIMLLAATNQMCQDVAVVPLLWMIPLGLYLLTFIVCFQSDRSYSRPIFGVALALTAALATVVLFRGVFLDVRGQLVVYALTVFIFCMVCHGELVRLKPGQHHLTAFYLAVAAGGAAGGVFVTLVAPVLFVGYWEFQFALIIISTLFLVVLFRDRRGRLYHGRPFWAWALMHLGLAGLVIALSAQVGNSLQENLEMSRSFFGVLRVLEQDKEDPGEHRLTLMHGRIEHGFQMTDAEKRYWPTSYYGPDSGVGLAIRFHPNRRSPANPSGRLRIGVVGLGTGTLASYGEEGDSIRFYEINPDVVRVTDKYFTYRKGSPASIEVALGDARMLMEQERSQKQRQDFDVLAVDAFDGDAVPAHLLTKECYSVYKYHLKADGILAIHVSSRYFNLTPVVRALASLDPGHRVEALWIDASGNAAQETDSSDWVLLTANRRFLECQDVQSRVRGWTGSDPRPLLWSDDYTNLFRVMK
jgi:hypothetical protein